MQKFIKDFKAGEIVKAHGALFRVIEDAYESNGHRPKSAHLVTAHGPCDCAVAGAICIGGQETSGYIVKGRGWQFQGNCLAGQFEIVTI